VQLLALRRHFLEIHLVEVRNNQLQLLLHFVPISERILEAIASRVQQKLQSEFQNLRSVVNQPDVRQQVLVFEQGWVSEIDRVVG
jgi:hypothetical protein